MIQMGFELLGIDPENASHREVERAYTLKRRELIGCQDFDALKLLIQLRHCAMLIVDDRTSLTLSMEKCSPGGVLEAVRQGRLTDLVRFAEGGCDLNDAVPSGETPLTEAVRVGSFDIVRYLLQVGADVNQADEFGTTPLIQAARHAHLDILELLLNSGADLHHRQPRDGGATALHYAVDPSTIELLVGRGLPVDTRDDTGMTPLHCTALGGALYHIGDCVEATSALLRLGADMEAQSRFGLTPLMHALRRGGRQMVSHLIQCGARVNALNELGMNCVSIASHRGFHRLRLLKRIAAIKASEGLIAHELQCYLRDDVDTVRLLIQSGGDVRACSSSGVTALMGASAGLRRETAELLIGCGADVKATSNRGETPAGCATAAYDAIASLFARYNLDKDVQSEDAISGTLVRPYREMEDRYRETLALLSGK